MRRTRLLALAITIATSATTALAVVPDAVPNLPFMEAETSVGSIVVSGAAPVAPSAKTIDGDPSDWTGSITRIGGTSILSHGELVYQDFINDAWGADDGDDAARLATLDAVKEIEPRAYRLDSLQQAAGDQFDAPRPVGAPVHYGDTTASDAVRTQADIEEARIAADADNVYAMVRTTIMDDTPATAVLVLLDTEPGGSYSLSRGLGGITTKAEWALLFSGSEIIGGVFKGAGIVAGCSGTCVDPMSVATSGTGYTNTTEMSISRAFLASLGPLPDVIGVGIATGIADSDGVGLAAIAAGDAVSDLVNVAFRREPARIWMDREQALALRTGNIDADLTTVRLSDLTSGATQTFRQRPGYYEAIYVDSTSPVNQERSDNSYEQGIFQHYGVYLPQSYRPGGVYGSAFWFHYRGGHAHDAAAWEPGILREFGDEPGLIVVTPSARGTSSWYTGRGMVDFLDVWDDAMSRWSIDQDRVYIGGHSMGGWASYLLGLVMPDRWAASNPEDGLVVPGLWAGAGAPSDPQNGADVNAEFLYNILENARNLPYAILHGTEDELVPVTSTLGISERFVELGYRFRTYHFHAYEHYSAPIWDDWRDVVKYMTQFRRDANPAHVTYKVWPALDHAISTISAPSGVDLGLHFNSAYWVSGLQTRTSGIDPSNIGSFDGTTFGHGVPQVLALPEAGGCGQVEPCTMFGQWHLANGALAAKNGFNANLANIGSGTVNLERMAIGTGSPISATITTDGPSTLTLSGTWSSPPVVTGASSSNYSSGALTLTFDAAGTYPVAIG